MLSDINCAEELLWLLQTHFCYSDFSQIIMLLNLFCTSQFSNCISYDIAYFTESLKNLMRRTEQILFPFLRIKGSQRGKILALGHSAYKLQNSARLS